MGEKFGIRGRAYGNGAVTEGCVDEEALLWTGLAAERKARSNKSVGAPNAGCGTGGRPAGSGT